MIKRLALFFIALLWLVPNAAHAVNFNRLLEDSAVFTVKMSLSRIQTFLDSKGALGEFSSTVDGTAKTAAQIIFEAQETFGISAQFLLTTIQKESSLVTAPTLSNRERFLNWATGYAVCDSCSISDPDIQKYKGFANQVTWAAQQFRRYANLPNNYHFHVGSDYSIDQTYGAGDFLDVTIENQATAGMYNYTPYRHGNKNAVDIFTSWFDLPVHPPGTLVRVDGENGGIYVIAPDGTLRPFTSRAAFFSNYNLKDVITIPKSEKNLLEVGAPIRFASYSLVRTVPGGDIYLVRGMTLHRIVSMEVFRQLGYNFEEVQSVPVSDILGYDIGAPITLADQHPAGALLQSKETGGIWYVENGIRYALPHRAYLAQYPYLAIQPVTEEELSQYENGGKRKLKDGTLTAAQGVPAVYVISNGEKRAFDSRQTFDSLGYQWKNIVWVDARTLANDIHPTGDPVTLDGIKL